jgi:AcrR family transcriptional regulator
MTTPCPVSCGAAAPPSRHTSCAPSAGPDRQVCLISILNTPSTSANPRERLLRTAYELFTRHGVAAIGVDRIVAEAGVAKMTLYRHFSSKDDLVLAALDLREALWTEEWFLRELELRETAPDGRLLAIFDLFDEWFRRDDFEGCFFINSLVESRDPTSRVRVASVHKLENIRALVKGFAEELGIAEPDDFARKWQTLMSGAITMAVRGDREAARGAKELGRLLLEDRLGS